MLENVDHHTYAFKPEITNFEFVNAIKIYYIEDYFVVVQEPFLFEGVYLTRFVFSPATDKNWATFKNYYFAKKHK